MVQRKFLRCLLGVRNSTPNASVLGEVATFPLAHTAATLLCRFWNRLVDMPDDRLAKQAFMENVALTASGTGNVRSACWAAQVDSFLPFMQPIVDGVPQYMDPDALSAALQRRYFDSVNDSDMRKVQDWLQIRGPLNFDSYSLPSHMQDISSRSSRVRLAQFRTGSHWLGVESGRWIGLQREQRVCKRCGCGALDDEAHMIWGCSSLIDQRLRHIDLFADGAATVESFLQQDAADLAAFLRS